MQSGVFGQSLASGRWSVVSSLAHARGSLARQCPRGVLALATVLVGCVPGSPATTDSETSETSSGPSSDASSGEQVTTGTTGEPDTGSSSSGPVTESDTDATTPTTGTTDPAPVCGDGQQDPGEACDDGNQADDDACLAICEPASCGDGHVQQGVEDCDDGNQVDEDGCSNACVAAVCGDGELQAGETCDDGDADDADDCPSTCQTAVCGDGFAQAGVEACDEGEMTSTCDVDCSPVECGDGVANTAALEQCDDGVATGTCDADCTLAECGDNQLSPLAGEECDDGNLSDNDDCSSSCKKLRRTIFVTSKLYTGKLGGLAGADAQCQMLANTAKLPGVFLAWLSDGATTPASRFVKSAVPYVLTTGIPVAQNWKDLTDGTLNHAIDTTESQGLAPTPAGGCGGGTKPTVWTNSLANGTAWGADNCGGWNNTAGVGRLGHAKATSFAWSKFCEGQAGSCAWQAALYCVEQ
jgi:cysteine-rich repeat protein